MNEHNMNISSHYKMIWYMIIASIILGYILMPILIKKNKTMNLNKIYQALLMGATMGVISVLLIEELTMGIKCTWIVLFLIVTIVLIYCIRKQTFVTEKDFTKCMIEHHEMGIELSKQILSKASTKDPFIQQLANNIIQSQDSEIQQMQSWLLLTHSKTSRT